MSVIDKLWDGMQTVIKMNDKVERMSAVLKTQQDQIMRLTERTIRLEAIIEVMLRGDQAKPTQHHLEHKN